MISLRCAAAFTFLALASGRVAHAAPPARCLSGLVPALTAGHFSGSVDCERDEITVRRVAIIQTPKHKFAIYDYRYRLRPPCEECSSHGGQRILFLRDGQYLGQYKPDAVELKVRRSVLVFTPSGCPDPQSFKRAPRDSRKPIAVSMTDAGPPTHFWVGGEELRFFR